MSTRCLCTMLTLIAFTALGCDSGDEAQGQGSAGPTDASADVLAEVDPGDVPQAEAEVRGEVAGDVEFLDPDMVWVDEANALIWQRVSPVARMSVTAALVYCEENPDGLPGLGWHLPNVTELRTLVRGCPATEPEGACGLTESCTDFEACWSTDCWSTCMLGDGPGGCYRETELEGESCSAAWSSDSVDDQMGRYWYLNFRRAGLHHDIPEVESEVRCVRWLQ